MVHRVNEYVLRLQASLAGLHHGIADDSTAWYRMAA
jgi:hypothetical protein